MRAGGSERGECGGGDGECGPEWGGECRPKGASEVSVLVGGARCVRWGGMVSAAGVGGVGDG